MELHAKWDESYEALNISFLHRFLKRYCDADSLHHRR